MWQVRRVWPDETHEKWLYLTPYSFTYNHHTQKSLIMCTYQMICQCGHSSCDNKRLLEVVELSNLFPEQHQARGADGWAGGSSLCASSCPPSLSFTPGYLSWWSGCTWTVTAHSTVFSDEDHQSCFALKLHLWAETAQDLIDEQTSCWGSRRRAGRQQD